MKRKDAEARSRLDRRIAMTRKALNPDAIADRFGLSERAGRPSSEFDGSGVRTQVALAYFYQAVRLLALYLAKGLGRLFRR